MKQHRHAWEWEGEMVGLEIGIGGSCQLANQI